VFFCPAQRRSRPGFYWVSSGHVHVNMFTVKASKFHLQCVIMSENCCDRNAEAAENGHFFNNLWGFFFSKSVFYTHSSCTCSTPSRDCQGWESAVCVCAILAYELALLWQWRRFRT
jgi:hypothetical protein